MVTNQEPMVDVPFPTQLGRGELRRTSTIHIHALRCEVFFKVLLLTALGRKGWI